MKKFLAMGAVAVAGALAIPSVALAAPGDATGDPGTRPPMSAAPPSRPPVVTAPSGLPSLPTKPAEQTTSPAAGPTSPIPHGSPPASPTPSVVTMPPGLPGEGLPDDPAVETTAPPAATTAPATATITATTATSPPVGAIGDAPVETTVAPAPPAQADPPAAGSGGGDLAKTGSNLAVPVGLGAALVAAGVCGVLFARRRRQFAAE